MVFDCKVSQGGVPFVSVYCDVKAPTRRIAYNEVITPEPVLRHNDAYARLLRRCEGLGPVSCAVVHPCDRDSLLGPLEAAKRELIEPVLVGPEAKIRAGAERSGSIFRRTGSWRPSTATAPPRRRWPWRAPVRSRLS